MTSSMNGAPWGPAPALVWGRGRRPCSLVRFQPIFHVPVMKANYVKSPTSWLPKGACVRKAGIVGAPNRPRLALCYA